MKIIAHRGYWLTESEQNTSIAIERALQNGFGVETDFRDCNGEVVIAHNPPIGNEPKAEDILQLCKTYDSDAFLAMNIKSDGLQSLLKCLLEKYDISNYFLFDMSIPDMVEYTKMDLNIASRKSEYEYEMPFYDKTDFVWIDSFNSDWISKNDIQQHLDKGKKVCIVSSELHQRPNKEIWEKYADIVNERLMICTDYPVEADMFFNRK